MKDFPGWLIDNVGSRDREANLHIPGDVAVENVKTVDMQFHLPGRKLTMVGEVLTCELATRNFEGALSQLEIYDPFIATCFDDKLVVHSLMTIPDDVEFMTRLLKVNA